tara:strand:+ start:313 stop:825 length:513 start_codon:yes stop_codon:yes gene_type:complete
MHNIFYLKRYVVFGWSVFKRGVEKGDKFSSTIPQECTPDDVKLDTLWVKGEITAELDGVSVDRTRVAGYFSADSGSYPKGTVVFECIEDSDWWCHPRYQDNQIERIVSAIRIKAGETKVFPAGTLGIIFDGSEAAIDGKPVTEPTTFEAPSSVTVTATTDTYGFTFSRRK